MTKGGCSRTPLLVATLLRPAAAPSQQHDKGRAQPDPSPRPAACGLAQATVLLYTCAALLCIP
eukprot:359586-Chlamydomonas_euryale.AAC.16